MSKTLVLLSVIAFSFGQILYPNDLLFRFSFDSAPPTDAGVFTRGVPTIYGSVSNVPAKLGNGAQFNAGTSGGNALALGEYLLAAPLTVTAWFSIDNAVINGNYYMKVLSRDCV